MRYLQSVIKYNNKIFGIIKVRYKKTFYPVLLDGKDYLEIRNLKKQFRVDQWGQVYCLHKYNNIEKKIYIHRLVMALHDKTYIKNTNNKKLRIYHLTNINLDNRYDNLSNIKTNNTYKTRTLKLEDPNVNPDMLPQYVSYMKPNKTHGSRFVVKFSNILWKSSSSTKLSLKFKLEQTKKFLRTILLIPEIQNMYYKTNNKIKEEELIKSYNTIVRRAGFIHIKQKINSTNKSRILKYDAKNLTKQEKTLLKNFIVNLAKYQTINPIIP